MEREESILETVGGVAVCLLPLWLCFTYSGHAFIKYLLTFII